MKITAKQSTLDGYVKRADAYTSKEVGDADYLKSILIEADDKSGSVRFTAQNSSAAIEFEVSDIDILEGGTVLVDSQRLKTVLAVIESGQKVEIETLTEKYATLKGGRAEVRLPLTVINEASNTLIPRIEKADKKGVTVASTSFREGFRGGAVTTELSGQHPVLAGVHIDVVEGKLRFLSFSGHAVSYKSVATESVKNDEFQAVILPNQVYSALDYIGQGTQVTLLQGKGGNTNQLHLVVESVDKEGDKSELYHILLSTVADGIEQYPLGKLLGAMGGLFSRAEATITTSHGQLLRIFHSAERISALNREGRGKEVAIKIDREDFTVAVDGDTAFEDSIELQQTTLDKGDFTIRWGLYGDAFEAYPSGEDGTFHAAVVRGGPESRIVALAFYLDEGDFEGRQGGLPTDFFTLVPTATQKV